MGCERTSFVGDECGLRGATIAKFNRSAVPHLRAKRNAVGRNLFLEM